MFIKKKVIVKLFKSKDSKEIFLLKKRFLLNFLNVKIRTQYVFFKKKVIVKLFEPKDCNKCVYQKKGYCETF